MEVEATLSDDSKVAEFCSITGAEAADAQKFLEKAKWNLQVALETFLEGCEIYNISCPYPDCSRLYEVRHDDCRCRKVRCGGVVYEGKFWQLPQHASREKILKWLEPTWKGESWPGWGSERQGCGRPFRFPADLSPEIRNEGFLALLCG